ncbi:hypothetical protein QWY31_02275 [Cytophagales bacterium LB-30]|uniref:Lipoprotein n=1 Tax=Shiella aurantiaca TaxID=3058365 RepID=A0ABT8F1I2_9BACT|nr:hypothetical protein [Shiella aurantiaca]MDN4164307.1 hypothetical protein [Shiella aurantiaca]
MKRLLYISFIALIALAGCELQGQEPERPKINSVDFMLVGDTFQRAWYRTYYEVEGVPTFFSQCDSTGTMVLAKTGTNNTTRQVSFLPYSDLCVGSPALTGTWQLRPRETYLPIDSIIIYRRLTNVPFDTIRAKIENIQPGQFSLRYFWKDPVYKTRVQYFETFQSTR